MSRTSRAATPPIGGARPPWRQVALPREHGGWGLTAEPVLLGLLVAPSIAGAAIAGAAFLAFLVRTPLAVVLVDRHRHRWLRRSRLAATIALVELAVLAALAGTAVLLAGWRWLVPVAIAAPLVAIELGFDARSRGRRLLPELCGAVGIAATVAAIALAGGADPALAAALWVVLAARSIASIPFVRTQIERLHGRPASDRTTDGAQLVGLVVAAVAVLVDPSVLAGAIAVGVLAVLHAVVSRTPPRPAKVLGIAETLAGLVVVIATAAGAAA